MVLLPLILSIFCRKRALEVSPGVTLRRWMTQTQESLVHKEVRCPHRFWESRVDKRETPLAEWGYTGYCPRVCRRAWAGRQESERPFYLPRMLFTFYSPAGIKPAASLSAVGEIGEEYLFKAV